MFILGLIIGMVVGGFGATFAIILCSVGGACDNECVQKHDDENSEK